MCPPGEGGHSHSEGDTYVRLLDSAVKNFFPQLASRAGKAEKSYQPELKRTSPKQKCKWNIMIKWLVGVGVQHIE